MQAPTFGDRLRQWARPTSDVPAIAPEAPLFEQVVAHPNPLGMLDWLKRQHPHSMPVGVSRLHEMIYTKPETTLVPVGPARALGGKSASFTVPVLIEHNGPAIVMSLRTDALLTSVAMRSIRGPVYMSNPDGLNVPQGVQEMRWSLVVGAEDLDASVVTCRAFLKSAVVINSSTQNAGEAMHFTEQGGTILGVVCHFAAVTGRDFRWVYELVVTGDLEAYDNVLGVMNYWDDKRPYQMLSGILSMPGDRERGSILTTLNVAMAAYQTQAALRSTDNPNIDPAALIRGDQDEENPWLWFHDERTSGKGAGPTLYLIAGDKPISAAINVAIVTQLIEARHRLYRDDEQNGNAEAHPDVLFCLDEMANMPIPQMPELLAAPGRGCLFTGMLQDFSQLVKWGDLGKSMLTQMQQLIVFRGLRDADTLRLIESLCPTTPTERVMSSGKGDGSMLAASASPERLPGIPTYRIYSGINDDPTTVLYLGADGAPPDWIHIRPYYSDPMLLVTQVRTLRRMAWALEAHDTRRLLPLPNLDRDKSGRALYVAGGHELLSTYQEACEFLPTGVLPPTVSYERPAGSSASEGAGARW